MNFNFYDLFEFSSEIILDESLELEYNKIRATKGSHRMFDPFAIGNNDFVVTFLTQGGEIATRTGNLFGPDKGNTLPDDEVATYLASLVDNPLVKFYTDAGWRSFIKTNLIGIEVVQSMGHFFNEIEDNKQ